MDDVRVTQEDRFPSARRTTTHRGWAIRYDPPPVPYRDADWIATRPDDDGRCVRAATRGDVVRQIEEQDDDNAD